MNSTERQIKYRKRRLAQGDVRLHIWLSAKSKQSIDRASKLLGTSYRQLIEKFITQIDESINALECAY